MTPRPLCNFYAASCEKDGGVYEYSLFDGGFIEQKRKITCDRPMYLSRYARRIHVLLRAPFEGTSESGVMVLDEKSGTPIGDIMSTNGEVGCHITARGKYIFVANYISGSVSQIGGRTVVHSGGSIDPLRQASAHPHSVVLTPDGRYLFVADLGTDTVYVYTKELELLTTARVPYGAGPRHLAFSPRGSYLYCINEMGGSITVFAWDGRYLAPLKTYDLLKDGTRIGSGAAIKLSYTGRRLYVTERTAAEIITFDVDGAELSEICRVSSHGTEPRDIALMADDSYLVAANQWGGGLAIFSLDDNGCPNYLRSHELPSALCVLGKR